MKQLGIITMKRNTEMIIIMLIFKTYRINNGENTFPQNYVDPKFYK